MATTRPNKSANKIIELASQREEFPGSESDHEPLVSLEIEAQPASAEPSEPQCEEILIRCPSCGTAIVRGHSFCGSCGKKIWQSIFRNTLARQPEILTDRFFGTIVKGRYKVVEKLGEGGMGAVYRVEHLNMGKYMAMKVLLPQYSANKQLVQRFRREAKAVSKLNHIHTVSVFDFDVTKDGCLYLIMEYIRGKNLFDVLSDKGPIGPDLATHIAVQICGSLSEAHESGVVHRDLKPDNIMLVRTREDKNFVKVLDFGLAKLNTTGETQEKVTQEGFVMGTPYYMSPEQIRGHNVDNRADLYSLGALLYQSLTGQPPFIGDTPEMIMTQHLTNKPEPLRNICPQNRVPEPLEKIVRQLLAKDPDKRQANADQVRKELLEFHSAFALQLARGDIENPWDNEQVVSEIEEHFEIGQREDWDRQEKIIRVKQLAKWLATLGLLAAVATVATYLTLVAPAVVKAVEEEPNNKPIAANRIEFNKPIEAFMGKRMSDSKADQDWYQIDNRYGHEIVFNARVSGVPNIDLGFQLFTRQTQQLELLWAADNFQTKGAGEYAKSILLKPNSTLYILVQGKTAKGQHPIENVSDAYRLEIQQEVRSRYAEYEPNDTPKTAVSVDIGAQIRGQANRWADKDYYTFKPQNDEPLAVVVTTKTMLRPRIRIQKSQGTWLPLTEDPLVPAAGQAYLVEIQNLGFGDGFDYSLQINPVAANETEAPISKKKSRKRKRLKAK